MYYLTISQIIIIYEKIINMPTISKQNQELLDKSIKAGIKPEHLIEKYGIHYVLNLLKEVYKDQFSAYISYPPTKNKNREKFQEKYQQELLAAGFVFYEFQEDFVDEDTGEVVSIDRKNIYCIK
jgi:hypothetical protein